MKKQLIIGSTFVLSCLAMTAQSPVKKVLMEEFTTTLCGMCPPKTYAVNQWHEQHAANTVLLTIHEGFGTDAMSNSFTDAIEQEFSNPSFGFAPAIMLDRVTYPWVATEPYMTTNDFDTIAQRIINTETPRVSVGIQGTYNSATRQIDAIVTANFLQTVPSGSYRINLYVVEDSVIGVGTGYDQKCYDQTFGNTHYPGQYNPSTDYISGYPHRHVLRAAMTTTWGVSGIIPSTPIVGTNYSTANLSYTLPANFNDSRISLVAFVAHHANASSTTAGNGNRWVLNAEETHLQTSFATGIEDAKNGEASSAISVFPNPSAGIFTVSYKNTEATTTSLYVTDITGKVVHTAYTAKQIPVGNEYANIDLSGFSPGVYFTIIENEKGKFTRKIILQ